MQSVLTLARAGLAWVLAIVVCLLACSARPIAGQGGSVLAVVVHPDVQTDDLTLADLRRLLLGDREFWPSGQRVTILIRSPVSRERDVILRDVCEMTEAQFRTHWIGKVFRAETPTGPRIVSSTSMAIAQVRDTPGAITFVDDAAVGPGVKVLAIDGRRPGDPGYRFR